MLELDKKVFGKITTKEIIGADPPAIPDTKDNFEKELVTLLSELESTPKEGPRTTLRRTKNFWSSCRQQTWCNGFSPR